MVAGTAPWLRNSGLHPSGELDVLREGQSVGHHGGFQGYDGAPRFPGPGDFGEK